MQSTWVQLFCHPLFRKGWTDHIKKEPLSEEMANNVVYLFGRLMAAESGMKLPNYVTWLTTEMVEVIKACPAFEKQMAVSQWLQAGKDPALMKEELGTKQGDKTI